MPVINNIHSYGHLLDTRLSLKALGLLVRLQTCAAGANVSALALSQLCADGETSIRTTINELERAGYLTKRRGNRNRLVYELHERKV